MAFTILAVFPDMSTEKIAKMSPRNFFWKYEEACKKVHVKPLATYDGDGILDIKKYIHKMKRVRNIALGRGEHAIV